MDFGLIRNDPHTQRILAAHARDLALVYPSTFLHLGPKPQGQESEGEEFVELESDDATAIDNECEPSGHVGTSKDAPSRAKGRGMKLDRRIR